MPLTMNIITFPNSLPRLHQPFEPAGDQSVVIAQLVEGVNDGLAFRRDFGTCRAFDEGKVMRCVPASCGPARCLQKLCEA